MKKIYFIRSAPYQYLVDHKDLYDSFDLVATKKIDPKLKRGAIFIIKKNIPDEIKLCGLAFCSPNQRSQDTAKSISKKIIKNNSLLEINYKMSEIISKDDFYNNGIKEARIRFVNNFIEDKLSENYNDVLNRIEIVLNLVLENKEKNILIVSHGFYLKVIEAYVRNPKIKENPKLLKKYFDGENETFKFCEGFILFYQNKRLFFDSYIRNKSGL